MCTCMCVCNGNFQLGTGQSPCTGSHQIFISSVRTFFQNQISVLRHFLFYNSIVTFYNKGNIFCLCLGRRSQPQWRKFLFVCYKPKILFRSFGSSSCVSNVCFNEKVAHRMVFPICNIDKTLSLWHICCCYCFW